VNLVVIGVLLKPVSENTIRASSVKKLFIELAALSDKRYPHLSDLTVGMPEKLAPNLFKCFVERMFVNDMVERESL